MLYDVSLEGFDGEEIMIIDTLMTVCGFDSNTAYLVVDNMPIIIARNVELNVAQKVKKAFEFEGAYIQITEAYVEENMEVHESGEDQLDGIFYGLDAPGSGVEQGIDLERVFEENASMNLKPNDYGDYSVENFEKVDVSAYQDDDNVIYSTSIVKDSVVEESEEYRARVEKERMEQASQAFMQSQKKEIDTYAADSTQAYMEVMGYVDDKVEPEKQRQKESSIKEGSIKEETQVKEDTFDDFNEFNGMVGGPPPEQPRKKARRKSAYNVGDGKDKSYITKQDLENIDSEANLKRSQGAYNTKIEEENDESKGQSNTKHKKTSNKQYISRDIVDNPELLRQIHEAKVKQFVNEEVQQQEVEAEDDHDFLDLGEPYDKDCMQIKTQKKSVNKFKTSEKDMKSLYDSKADKTTMDPEVLDSDWFKKLKKKGEEEQPVNTNRFQREQMRCPKCGSTFVSSKKSQGFFGTKKIKYVCEACKNKF